MVPKKDETLASWSRNFGQRLNDSYEALGFSEETAAEFWLLQEEFAVRYAAVRVPGQWSKAATTAKDTAKRNLQFLARQLYATLQASRTVPDGEKVLLGVLVRKLKGTPIGRPTEMPRVGVLSVIGRHVRLSICDASRTRKGRAPNTAGALLYVFVGDEAPEGPDVRWRPIGNVTRNSVVVLFGERVRPAEKVWFCAAWYTNRGLIGPASTPIFTGIGYEGALPIKGLGAQSTTADRQTVRTLYVA